MHDYYDCLMRLDVSSAYCREETSSSHSQSCRFWWRFRGPILDRFESSEIHARFSTRFSLLSVSKFVISVYHHTNICYFVPSHARTESPCSTSSSHRKSHPRIFCRSNSKPWDGFSCGQAMYTGHILSWTLTTFSAPRRPSVAVAKLLVSKTADVNRKTAWPSCTSSSVLMDALVETKD
jgi:hypothetical protein